MLIKKTRKRKGTPEEQLNRDKFQKLRSFLRRCWTRWPERIACLIESRRSYKGPNKRQKWESNCKMCNSWFKLSEMTVDHIIPCGTFLCSDDYKTFIPNLFCDRSNLQVLCKECHNIKSANERGM